MFNVCLPNTTVSRDDRPTIILSSAYHNTFETWSYIYRTPHCTGHKACTQTKLIIPLIKEKTL